MVFFDGPLQVLNAVVCNGNFFVLDLIVLLQAVGPLNHVVMVMQQRISEKKPGKPALFANESAVG